MTFCSSCKKHMPEHELKDHMRFCSSYQADNMPLTGAPPPNVRQGVKGKKMGAGAQRSVKATDHYEAVYNIYIYIYKFDLLGTI